MAASVDNGNRKSVCFILLIGLPGSGKTFLTNFLVSFLGRPMNDTVNQTSVVPVTYDDFIVHESDYKDNWKQKRRVIFNLVEKLVCHFKGIDNLTELDNEFNNLFFNKFKCTDKNDLYIVIDDNMYYRSMRYEYYRLAKQYGTGFCQVYLETTPEKAAAFNKNRVNAVPDSVIQRMHSVIEPPNSVEFSWERRSICIPSFVNLNEQSVSSELRKVVSSAMLSPEQLTVSHDSTVAVSKVICAKNIVHQVDVRLRRMVSSYVKEVKGSLNDAGKLKVLVDRVNGRRVQIIHELKADSSLVPAQLINLLQCDNRNKVEDDEINAFLLALLLSH